MAVIYRISVILVTVTGTFVADGILPLSRDRNLRPRT
jgi:hypothetical protein